MGDYRKLRVWHAACEFADSVHQFASRLPQPERSYAWEQLLPAADGIHENIAEGCGFNNDRQMLKYARQALSTANESEDELLALERRGFMGAEDRELLAKARSVCAQVAAFIQRLEADVSRAAGRRKRPRKPRADAERRKPGPEADS
jgi:four helix bundle protein